MSSGESMDSGASRSREDDGDSVRDWTEVEGLLDDEDAEAVAGADVEVSWLALLACSARSRSLSL